MNQDKHQSEKLSILNELDRRIRGARRLEANVVEQMERDQRNADHMSALIKKIAETPST